MPEPVIVMGMHRSGTTLMVRVLEKMGLFMGHDQDPNAEARFFLRINERLLGFAGARWDQPEAMLRLLEDEALCERLGAWLEDRMTGPETRLFMRKSGWLRYRDVRRYPKPWGWKDPRNTLTLPLWRRLFPSARVIHVVRHGAAVAASLRAREDRLRRETLERFPERGAWRLTSALCLDPVRGLNLWGQYLDAAAAALAGVPESLRVVVRYEDLLTMPEAVLARLAAFLGAHPIDDGALNLNRERADAWREGQPWVEQANERARHWLAHWYPEQA